MYRRESPQGYCLDVSSERERPQNDSGMLALLTG